MQASKRIAVPSHHLNAHHLTTQFPPIPSTPPQHRQSIEQEHRILAGLKGAQKRARTLVDLYDDKDKLMNKLKSEIGGYNNDAFYKRYRATNQYYARYPNATAQADPAQVSRKEFIQSMNQLLFG
jgi:hypothetical protein